MTKFTLFLFFFFFFKISFFKMGSENLTEQLEEFLTNIGTSVQK